MRVMAQMGMVMNLDKASGATPVPSPASRRGRTAQGVEYVWFNNVETRPGQGYP